MAARTYLREPVTHSQKARQLNSKAFRERLYKGTCMADTSKNRVEMKKLALECEKLNESKNRIVSKINSEKHMLKLYLRRLQLKGAEDCGDIDENIDSYLHTGSRFKSNGDLRMTSQTRTDLSQLDLNLHDKKSSFEHRPTLVTKSEPAMKKHSTISGVVVSNPPKAFSEHANLQQKQRPDAEDIINVQREIQAIEETLLEITKENEARIQQETSHNPATFLRAHTNDSQPPLVKQNLDMVRMKVYNHPNDRFAFKPGSNSFGKKAICGGTRHHLHKKTTDRSKVNCVACEFRLRQHEEDLVSKKKVLEVRPSRRWNFSYHSRLAENAQKDSMVAKGSSASVSQRTEPLLTKTRRSINSKSSPAIDTAANRANIYPPEETKVTSKDVMEELKGMNEISSSTPKFKDVIEKTDTTEASPLQNMRPHSTMDRVGMTSPQGKRTAIHRAATSQDVQATDRLVICNSPLGVKWATHSAGSVPKKKISSSSEKKTQSRHRNVTATTAMSAHASDAKSSRSSGSHALLERVKALVELEKKESSSRMEIFYQNLNKMKSTSNKCADKNALLKIATNSRCIGGEDNGEKDDDEDNAVTEMEKEKGKTLHRPDIFGAFIGLQNCRYLRNYTPGWSKSDFD